MKFTQLYVQMLLIVKSKRDLDLYFESRHTPRDTQDQLNNQTHVFIYDHYAKKTLLFRFYDDNNPDTYKQIKQDIAFLETQLGSPDRDDGKKYGKYMKIYQGLINRTKWYKDMIFKLVMIQLKGNQTSFSLEWWTEPIMFYVDEDQDESYRDLVKVANAIKTVSQLAEEDDQMNIL